MTSEGGNNDPTARRRRIAERGSDRLALITGRGPNLPSPQSPPSAADDSQSHHHSYNASCPPSLTRLPDQILSSGDENMAETGNNKIQPESSRESTNETQSSPNKSKSDLKFYLYKTLTPNQLRPAILASQDTRRKFSVIAGIIALLSYIGFPVLSSYIIRNIILSRPLVLLLIINFTITVGPLLLDAIKLMEQEAGSGSGSGSGSSEAVGSPLEWGMLVKTGLSALFMDSCIYSVVVVCGISVLQKFGL